MGKDLSGMDRWPTWKLLLTVVPGFGIFGALVGVFPDYSPAALALGIAMTIGAALVTAIGSDTRSWYLQVAYVAIWSAMFVAIAVRGWAALLPYPWVWLTLHLVLYLAVWTLPAIASNLSAFLAREQTNPQTRFGIGCLRFSVPLLPLAGGIGAVIGLYGPRYGLDNWVVLFISALGSAVGLGIVQYFGHHLWSERPWGDIGPATG